MEEEGKKTQNKKNQSRKRQTETKSTKDKRKKVEGKEKEIKKKKKKKKKRRKEKKREGKGAGKPDRQTIPTRHSFPSSSPLSPPDPPPLSVGDIIFKRIIFKCVGRQRTLNKVENGLFRRFRGL